MTGFCRNMKQTKFPKIITRIQQKGELLKQFMVEMLRSFFIKFVMMMYFIA